MLNEKSKDCFVCRKQGGMFEIFRCTDPYSSSRKIAGRDSLGHISQLSVEAEQFLLIL